MNNEIKKQNKSWFNFNFWSNTPQTEKINYEKLKTFFDDEYNKLNKNNNQHLFTDIFKNIMKINNENDIKMLKIYSKN